MRAQVGMYTDEKTISNSRHLEKLLQDTGLTSLNGQSKPSETDKQYWWTRYDKPNNTYKCLDYVLVSPALAERAPTFSVHYKHLDSDHCAVTAEVVSPMCFSRRTAKRARRKVFRTDRLLLNSSKSNKKQVHLAVKEYMDELAASFTGFNPGDGPGDYPDTVVQDFIQRTERALENSVGPKWPNPRFSRRWFDDELKELIEERRRAYRSFIDSLQHGDKETSASLWSNFRACRKKCKSATKEKKRAEWEEYIQDVSEAYRRYHKNLWTLLRRVMPDKGKKGRVELTPMQAQDGSLVTSEEEIMEVWEDHQRALGTPVTDGWDEDFSRKVRREVEGYASANPQPADEETDKDFTPAEVKAALDHAENYKSPADDGTTYTMFKQGGATMVEKLSQLFNYLNMKESTPSNWGTATIVNIFKEGDNADRTEPGDYRGIALISCLGKLYLSIWARRIARRAEGRLDNHQGGFRLRRSTADQILTLWETLRGRSEMGKPTFLFFIDFRKAFDTVWHDGLWHRLWESGIQSKPWRILRQLYRNVQARVRVGDRLTSPVRMQQGVRQGCPLSPVLFNLFVDELSRRLRRAGYGVNLSDQELHALLYADDVVILAKSKEDLQKMIDVVEKYCREWHMVLNLGKSKVMVVGGGDVSAKRALYEKSFRFRGKFVEVVDKYKYLGVIISPDLSWSKHTDYTITKATTRQASIRRVLTNGKIDARARLLVWKAQVRPILEYGSEVWEPPNHKKGKLNTLQQEAGTLIFKLNKKTKREAVNLLMQAPSQNLRRTAARLRYFAKLFTFEESALHR